MVLKSRNLCGIIVTGGVLSISGVFPLMSPYRTTLMYPFLIFSVVSACRAAMAVDEFAEGCGTRRRAASMWSIDQSTPLFSGKPSIA